MHYNNYQKSIEPSSLSVAFQNSSLDNLQRSITPAILFLKNVYFTPVYTAFTCFFLKQDGMISTNFQKD